MFTVSLQTGPTDSPVREARWYVDNVQMGVITDVQQATHQLTYRVNDSAGKCLVGDHRAADRGDQRGHRVKASIRPISPLLRRCARPHACRSGSCP